ncbi:MAG TPA: hypothetical protein PLL19_08775, partial [Thiobacillaceae bacterium]|nr:hypothetical protein [Thiobacillaceae bacterium]
MAPIPNPADVARRLGLAGPGDLILHLPLRYLDETRLVPLDEARPGGLTQVEGHVLHAETQLRPRRQLVVEIGENPDHGARLYFRLLHFYPSQQAQLK